MQRTLLSEAASPAEQISSSEPPDFDLLVHLHRPRIFRFILASLRDREAAENLTQDCFVRAYKGLPQFRGASNIATWLMQIAANLVRTHESSNRLKFWRRSLQPAIELEDVRDWIPDRHLSPEEMAAAKQQVQAIWKVAAGLSERQRTVFLLRFVEDMDVLEIVAVTGMKEGTVKTHLSRAVQSVRAGLEKKS
jgi:RNA polymerase sigma-70 factor (ECF subfamily)